MLDTTKIGASIHAHRKRAGLTQRKLGELAGIGISNISSYENGKIPCLYNAIAIADALRVSLDDLIGRVVMDCPTLTPPNEPLTLEQIREMVGKPAYLYIYDTALDSGWHIIKTVTKDKIIFRGWDTVYVPISSIGKCFDLYAYPPAHIDREAWEPCGRCEEKDCSNCAYGDDPEGRSHCKNCEGESWWRSEWTPYYDFCPWCGRPMTEHAWAELEKRVRGITG